MHSCGKCLFLLEFLHRMGPGVSQDAVCVCMCVCVYVGWWHHTYVCHVSVIVTAQHTRLYMD